MKSAPSKKRKVGKHGLDAAPNTSAEGKAVLTQAEIDAAKKLVERALRPRVLPVYSPDERVALAIVAANYSLLQRARGKKSRRAAKDQANYRRNHVNLLLRYVVDKRYRKNPNGAATVTKIIEWLGKIDIEASESQVRRDIHAALKSGSLPTG